MALSSFEDRTAPPQPAALREALGRTAALWEELGAHVLQTYGPLEEQWAFAGAKFGWSLRLRDRKRVVVYLIPCAGHFLAAVVLGDRAVAAAREAKLPAAVLELIDGATRYAEGTGIRVPVRTRADLRAVQKLVALKLAP